MIIKNILSVAAVVVTLSACSDGGGSSGSPNVETRPALDLAFSDAPIELPNITASFAADLAYGDAERNTFDIFLPDCEDPTPLVVYIHGGGFTGGNKQNAYNHQTENIQDFLRNCVAVASINYTLLDVPGVGGDVEAAADQGGVLRSLRDTARALQFMRYHYASLNLEAENVAVYGGSAGAGAGLWLGTRDDMADPENADPILRESTRVKAVGALGSQSTYDILDWEQILLPITEPFAPIFGGTDVPTLAAAIGASNYLLAFLGISSIDQLGSEQLAEYRAGIDMLELMDSGDAPIFLYSFQTGPDDLLNLFLHHALHAFAVKERADEVGLEAVAYSEDSNFPLEDPSGETLTSFLMRHIL